MNTFKTFWLYTYTKGPKYIQTTGASSSKYLVLQLNRVSVFHVKRGQHSDESCENLQKFLVLVVPMGLLIRFLVHTSGC